MLHFCIMSEFLVLCHRKMNREENDGGSKYQVCVCSKFSLKVVVVQLSVVNSFDHIIDFMLPSTFPSSSKIHSCCCCCVFYLRVSIESLKHKI